MCERCALEGYASAVVCLPVYDGPVSMFLPCLIIDVGISICTDYHTPQKSLTIGFNGEAAIATTVIKTRILCVSHVKNPYLFRVCTHRCWRGDIYGVRVM